MMENLMNVPPAFHPLWSDIATGRIKPDFDFLPAKIIVGNISRRLAKDQSSANLGNCASELREIFAQNADLPKVQKDLMKIFG
jgi:hypothetical protein